MISYNPGNSVNIVNDLNDSNENKPTEEEEKEKQLGFSTIESLFKKRKRNEKEAVEKRPTKMKKKQFYRRVSLKMQELEDEENDKEQEKDEKKEKNSQKKTDKEQDFEFKTSIGNSIDVTLNAARIYFKNNYTPKFQSYNECIIWFFKTYYNMDMKFVNYFENKPNIQTNGEDCGVFTTLFYVLKVMFGIEDKFIAENLEQRHLKDYRKLLSSIVEHFDQKTE